jgi:hypothetical protein
MTETPTPKPATASWPRATDPISGSPMVGPFPAPAGTDSPPVMPETRCVSKKWEWWPGAPPHSARNRLT